MADLDLNAFVPVRLQDGETLRAFFAAQNPLLSDYNFVILYCWGEIYQFRWQLFRERLLVCNCRDDFLLMPAGAPFPASELAELSAAIRRQGQSGRFLLATDEDLARDPELERHFRVQVDEADSDYIYRTQALVELKGNKLAKKKNLIAQFRKRFPDYRARPLAAADAAQCLELAERWSRSKALGPLAEMEALRRALAAFAQLELGGAGLFADSRLLAFSLFSRLNRSSAAIHFEKADPQVKGAAQAVNWETARLLVDRFTFLNREQDLGIEGLRRAKRSYSPELVARTHMLLPRT